MWPGRLQLCLENCIISYLNYTAITLQAGLLHGSLETFPCKAGRPAACRCLLRWAVHQGRDAADNLSLLPLQIMFLLCPGDTEATCTLIGHLSDREMAHRAGSGLVQAWLWLSYLASCLSLISASRRLLPTPFDFIRGWNQTAAKEPSTVPGLHKGSIVSHCHSGI